MVRFSYAGGYRNGEVDIALKKAFVWLQSCRGQDGGYSSIPLNACHYGAHSYTTSGIGESNLFATWFRSLCLAYVVGGLKVKNEYKLGRYPGYEINLECCL